MNLRKEESIDIEQTRERSLPPSWRVEPLSAINTRRPTTINPAKYAKETFEYYSIPAFQDQRRPAIARGSEIGSSKLLLDLGTVLFGKLNPRVEKVWRVGNYSSNRKLGSTEWIPIFPRQDVDEQFLFFLLWSEHVMPKAKTLVSGSTPSRQRVDPRSFYRIEVPLPPLAEQRKIAGVLGLVQRAIEQQERLIALTTELQKSLPHKLLTQGLRGEAQKQTEIGLVPQSWDVVSLGDVISQSPKNGLYKPSSAYGSGTLILRINDFSNDGDRVFSAALRVAINSVEAELYRLKEGDIVTNRVNSLSHLGKTALIGNLQEPMVFESNMMRFRMDESRAIPAYMLRILNSPVCKRQFLGSAKRAVGQASINQGNLRAIKVPLPSVLVQREVVDILETVLRKHETHQRTHAAISALFRTLLHRLMTAQLRVHDLKVDELLLGNLAS